MSTTRKFLMNGCNIGPCFEGSKGIRALEKVFSAIGYDSMEEFFEDNPGAVEAVFEWIDTTVDKVPQWKEDLFIEDDVEDSD